MIELTVQGKIASWKQIHFEDAQHLLNIGRDAIEMITDRIIRGRDQEGKQFPNYAAERKTPQGVIVPRRGKRWGSVSGGKPAGRGLVWFPSVRAARRGAGRSETVRRSFQTTGDMIRNPLIHIRQRGGIPLITIRYKGNVRLPSGPKRRTRKLSPATKAALCNHRRDFPDDGFLALSQKELDILRDRHVEKISEELRDRYQQIPVR